MKKSKADGNSMSDNKAPKATHLSRESRVGEGWQAEKSALTRQAILEAAVRCFVEYGYAQTTTAMIAEEARVSRAR